MSIISQIAMVVLILLTGIILIYANKGLESAALEGEKFVDEWAIRQMRKEEKEKERFMRRQSQISYESEAGRESYGSEEVFDDEPYETFDDGFNDEFNDEAKEEFEQSCEEKMDSYNTGRRELSVDQRITLILLDEEKNQKRSIEIDHVPFTIGRDLKNDFSINDLYVAKFHCNIQEKNGRFLLNDLGTSNKIFADGNVVSQFILNNESHFYIGGSEFVVKNDTHRSQQTILARKN